LYVSNDSRSIFIFSFNATQSNCETLVSSKGLNTLHDFYPYFELTPVVESQSPSADFGPSELTGPTENHLVYDVQTFQNIVLISYASPDNKKHISARVCCGHNNFKVW